jgi:hypothetical protein
MKANMIVLLYDDHDKAGSGRGFGLQDLGKA